jgi:hypothetical protein
MPVTNVETAPHPLSQKLRNQVRDRVEQEYQRLYTEDRPGLADLLAADPERPDAEQIRRALLIVDYRIAALQDHLETSHRPHPHNGICPRCCVLLDLREGRGPQWFLLAAIPGDNPRVIASDSALGRALIGARPGQNIHYPTPVGVQTARVIALEASASRV